MTVHELSDELQQFVNTFFEECAELLAGLETRLSEMDVDHIDPEDLHAIFRAIHSMKAGAGAFGFTQLVTFTHKFEALLDLVRDGQIQLGSDQLDVVVRATDVVADLIEMARNGEEPPDDYGSGVLEEIQVLIRHDTPSDETAPVPDAAEHALPTAEAMDEARSGGAKVFRIGFAPSAELFRHANEPLLLIRELKTLGPLEVEIDKSRLPSLAGLEPEDSYFSWTFELETTADRAAIEEVFEFVVDDCDLTIEERPLGEGKDVGDDTERAASAVDGPTAPGPASPDMADDRRRGADRRSGSDRRDETAGTGKAAKTTSIRVDLDRVDRLVNMVGELVITQAMLCQQSEEMEGDGNEAQLKGLEELAMHTREIQESVMAIRMQPVKSVFARMPRLARDLSAKLDKKVNLITSGENTELDKTVIEELGDPLTHMIRNSIDHGLESTEKRRAAGKPDEGTIHLSAEHRNGRIIIEVADDGGGIDRERVRDKAIERGIIAPNAGMSDQEIDNLIFMPGFSTAEEVTDVSGRGVGMDVVRRNINDLGGRVSLESTPGKGSRFIMTLPLTLAVLDGMIIAVGGEKFVLPLTSIIESFRPDAADVKTLVNSSQVVSVRG